MRTHICEKQGRVDNLNFRIKLLEFENSILQLENKEVICFFSNVVLMSHINLNG